jgi:hypothetical protein
MEESTTYQWIVERGRQEEARRILLLLGEVRFGAAADATRRTIEGIADLPRLEHLTAQLLSVGSWDELLPTRGQRRRNGGRKTRS